jgi:type IV secretory pathway VirB10-like protein
VNARIGLAMGGVAVAALVAFLVIKTRETPDEQTSAAAATTERAAGETETASIPQPQRMTGPADASPLPTPAEVAESRERVEEEHIRSPSHSPRMLDNHLDAQPLREARKAMQKGDYETALKAAEDALAVEESNNARVMAVMASCSMGNRAKAQAHADKLDDMRKSRVAVRCQKFGIEIKGAKPIDEEQ